MQTICKQWQSDRDLVSQAESKRRRPQQAAKAHVCLSSSEEESEGEDEESDYDDKNVESEDEEMTDVDSQASGDENSSPKNFKVAKFDGLNKWPCCALA